MNPFSFRRLRKLLPFRRSREAEAKPKAKASVRSRVGQTMEWLENRIVPSSSVVAIGADAGGGPRVTLLDRATGGVIQDFFAYDEAFSGGVRVAVGDFNADGHADVVTATGPGGAPHVKVFDGLNGAELKSFYAFDESFTGGVNLAVGDVNGDRKADIIVGADAGGSSHVKVFDGSTDMELASFFAFIESFTGGVRVAAGDINGDARADIVVSAGAGGGPHVKVFDGVTSAELSSFFAFDQTVTNGVFVGSADLNADGRAEIITGAGPGSTPLVRVFDPVTNGLLSEFLAYDAAFLGGVRVGAFALDATGRPGIVTAPGSGGGTDIRIFSAPGGVPNAIFSAFNSAFTGGAFISGSGIAANIAQLSNGQLGNFFNTPTPTGPTLVTLQLDPLNINLLGLQVQTSPITITVSVDTGDGKLLGNLLTVVANLVNLQGVNNALNNVLDSVVGLLNSASLSVTANVATGPLVTSPTATTTPVLDLFVAPIHLDLLGARVDTSPINLSIRAQSGEGLILGNALTSLANLFNPPLPAELTLDEINSRLLGLIADLDAQLPGFPVAPVAPRTLPAGTSQVLSLNVPPINVNLLGLVLKTSEIRVNADAQTGNGELLGNVLTTLLNTLGATPENLETLSNNLNSILGKVIGVLNSSSLLLANGAVEGLTQVLQTLALPNLVNTSGAPATSPILNLAIASTDGTTPPVDLDLLGLKITTSNIQAQLIAQTGEGQVLGNLLYNVSHLLDPGGSLNLLTILGQLGL